MSVDRDPKGDVIGWILTDPGIGSPTSAADLKRLRLDALDYNMIGGCHRLLEMNACETARESKHILVDCVT